MEPFLYGSPEFEEHLKADAHAAGEIEFLVSIVQPGMRILDIGANRGVVSVALARAVGPTGRVYAFEPVPEYFAALKENLARNRADNVEAFPLALGDREGPLPFYQRGEASGITPGEGAAPLTVQGATVDRFLADQAIDHIDLMSLDCEGSELRVFQGAASLLREQAPRIFCELHHDYLRHLGSSARDVAAFLEGFGYQVKPLQVEALGTRPALEECSHIYAHR